MGSGCVTCFLYSYELVPLRTSPRVIHKLQSNMFLFSVVSICFKAYDFNDFWILKKLAFSAMLIYIFFVTIGSLVCLRAGRIVFIARQNPIFMTVLFWAMTVSWLWYYEFSSKKCDFGYLRYLSLRLFFVLEVVIGRSLWRRKFRLTLNRLLWRWIDYRFNGCHSVFLLNCLIFLNCRITFFDRHELLLQEVKMMRFQVFLNYTPWSSN